MTLSYKASQELVDNGYMTKEKQAEGTVLSSEEGGVV